MSKLPIIRAEHITYYNFDEMCRVSSVDRQFLVQLVDHGILDPQGRHEREWRFAQHQLRRARRAAALKHDLNINVPGIGMILELLDEVEQLRNERERRIWP